MTYDDLVIWNISCGFGYGIALWAICYVIVSAMSIMGTK